MALEFKYNKTAMQELKGNLSIRVAALPTLQSKESALRMEVKKYRDRAEAVDEELSQLLERIDNMKRLWSEFDPKLVSLKEAHYGVRKIAGVRIPVLESIDYDVADFNMQSQPLWVLDGIRILKEILHLQLERRVNIRASEILEHARKKTTQKVNLYEKVQIPEYQEAIQKIKRFLEDEENLSKAAQKILKKRLQGA